MLIGMSSTICALGAVAGPPISGAINSATGGFKFVGIYAGESLEARRLPPLNKLPRRLDRDACCAYPASNSIRKARSLLGQVLESSRMEETLR